MAPEDSYGHDPQLARPHGAHAAAARRAHGPCVARLVRDRPTRPAAACARPDELFRKHALGSFDACSLDVTIDPAMLLFLSGTTTRKDAPNENYARELMELFTLGADRGLHRARRPRAGAGADRVDRRLPRQRRHVNFRFAASATTTASRRSSATPGNFDWRGLVPPLPRACGPRPVLRHPPVGPLRPARAAGLFHPVGAGGAVRSVGLRDPPRRSRRSWPTRTCTRARASSRRRWWRSPGMLRARHRGVHHRPRGPGSPTWPASGRSVRRTSPGGTSRPGSTPRASRVAGPVAGSS